MDVNVSAATGTHSDTQPLPRGWERASGTGRSDGDAFRHAGRGGTSARPSLDAPVENDGYRWWYVDALSDDRQHGLTIIGFVGSVFSPYYARARKRGPATPMEHCAINVALYGGTRRWAMTERGGRHVKRSPTLFEVGPSAMEWDGNELIIRFNERCSPLPFPIRGEVRLRASQFYADSVDLDSDGKHHWQAVAPTARVDVKLESPQLTWSGTAYHDMNWGSEPLELAFRDWMWLRAETPHGTTVLYDVTTRSGVRRAFGRRFESGHVWEQALPEQQELSTGFWGMRRPILSEGSAQLKATLEDAPFYTRNHVSVTIDDQSCDAVHESLSLTRFAHPVVQLMLPFRMPRCG